MVGRRLVTLILAYVTILIAGGCDFTFPGPGSSDWDADIEEEFELVRSSADMISLFWPQANKKISAKITALDWDDHYMVIKQQQTTGGEFPELTESFKYWIADRKNDSLHGPFTSSEFSEARHKLRIPTSLTAVPLPDLFVNGRLQKKQKAQEF